MGPRVSFLYLAVGDETSSLEYRVANLPSFQELADLGATVSQTTLETEVLEIVKKELG
jgi:hypothetical protein